MRFVSVREKGERTYAIKVEDAVLLVKVSKAKVDGKVLFSAEINHDSEKLSIHLATQGNNMKELRAMVDDALQLCLEENAERLAIARTRLPVPARR